MDERRAMSDRELVEALEAIAAEDRRCTVRLLRHLGEMDSRDLAVSLGFPNLFEYCVRKLRFSEAMAVWRIHTARAARDYPALLRHVESGELNITTIKLIAPYLTRKNADELIAAARGKRRPEVEAIIASLAPVAGRRDVVTKQGPMIVARASWQPAASSLESPRAAPLAPDVVEALDAARRRLHFDVGPETAELIERAREILRHKYPFASLEDIVREALNVLLELKDFDRTAEEAGRRTESAGRTIPLWVRKEVWKRDNGRCAFVAEDGTACGTRSWLEFDHVVPFAKGGRGDDPSNVRLLCRAHNQHAARRAFGPGHA